MFTSSATHMVSRTQTFGSCMPSSLPTCGACHSRTMAGFMGAAMHSTRKLCAFSHCADDPGWLKTLDEYHYGARQDIQARHGITTFTAQSSRRHQPSCMHAPIRQPTRQGTHHAVVYCCCAIGMARSCLLSASFCLTGCAHTCRSLPRQSSLTQWCKRLHGTQTASLCMQRWWVLCGIMLSLSHGSLPGQQSSQLLVAGAAALRPLAAAPALGPDCARAHSKAV